MIDYGPCAGKMKHLSKEDAKRHLRSAKRSAVVTKGPQRGKSNKNRNEQRTYECDVCGFWHVTSMSLEEYNSRRVR